MDESKLKALLEGECENILQDIRMAQSGSDEAKGMIFRLKSYHEMLMKEREFDLKAEKQYDDQAMRDKELEMKRSQMTDDYYFRNSDLKIKEAEQIIKQTQAKEGKLDRYIGYVITASGILIPFIGSWIWMGRSLKFEETGAFTSRAGQWIGNHMKLFKGKNG